MSSVSSSRPIPDKLDRLYLPIVIIFPITSGLPSQPCKNTCQLLEKKAHVTSVATDFFKTAAELIPIVQPYHTVPLDTREPPKQPSTPSDDSEFDHWATEQSSLSRKSPSLLHWESPPASLAASSIFASEQKLDFSPPQHPVDGDTHDTNLNGSVFTVLSAEPLLQSESFRTVDIITDTVGLTSATSLPSNFVYTNPTTMASNMKLDEGFDDMLIALPPSDDLP